jgi:hypothetical protein
LTVPHLIAEDGADGRLSVTGGIKAQEVEHGLEPRR